MATPYSRTEELISGLTHGAATLLSITGLVLMIVFSARYGTGWHIVSTAIYGASLVVLYISSTLYHLLTESRIKRIFQQLDHATIYLLIAGTYTPYTLVNLRGSWGWSLFGTVWTIALVGVILETRRRPRMRRLSLSLYLGMGWLMILAFKPLVAVLAPGGLILLLTGGLLYSFGIIFYVWKRLAYQHAIWHGFVVAGSICHFFSIFFYVIPPSS